MLPGELLRQVKWIELTTRRLMNSALSGFYQSQFKGQGVQFSENRPYLPGDDVRHINWKVSARTKEPWVKQFEEERERTVFLIADASSSMNFGSSQKIKQRIMAELGGMLAYAAGSVGDRVGLIVFSDQIETLIPAKKGKKHALHIIGSLFQLEALAQTRSQRGTQLQEALKRALRVIKHRGVVFVISDFLAENYEKTLGQLARIHEVTGLWIGDVRENQIPPLGHWMFADPETGLTYGVNTQDPSFQGAFTHDRNQFESNLKRTFHNQGADLIKIVTQSDYLQTFIRFFRSRPVRLKRKS